MNGTFRNDICTVVFNTLRREGHIRATQTEANAALCSSPSKVLHTTRALCCIYIWLYTMRTHLVGRLNPLVLDVRWSRGGAVCMKIKITLVLCANASTRSATWLPRYAIIMCSLKSIVVAHHSPHTHNVRRPHLAPPPHSFDQFRVVCSRFGT